ncbi:hypothetical protein ABZW11_18405 [Nonomuraea sp. NPDC004580]
MGGFVPPLVMGFIHGRLGSYGPGLALRGGGGETVPAPTAHSP